MGGFGKCCLGAGLTWQFELTRFVDITPHSG
jgi:hypothetical protein